MDRFGEKRVRDTPISENSILGVGVGAAMTGLRPIVEFMTVNFALLAMDQIVNHAAAIPYMFNGQVRVPMVVRMPGRRWAPARPDALAQPRGDVPADPGPAGCLPVHSRRRQGTSEGRDPRRQPGDLHRARDALRRPRRGSRERRPSGALRQGRDPARGLRRDDRRDPAHGAGRGAGGEDARQRARRRGGADRPAHAAPARPRHDPRLRAQDEPRG